MMTDNGKEDDDNLDNMINVNSSLLNDPKKISNSVEMPEIPFCGCLSVRYYQPYFDVDSVDVTNRISSALLFCRREQSFLSYCDEKPDAYGPFWISTTLVFIIAVTSHISGFLASWISGKNWSYDFQSVVTASSIIYGFATAIPVALWLILRHYEANLKLVTSICIYGYSLFVFIPAALLCIYPNWLLSWFSLLSAAMISSVFLLRNIGPLFIAHAKQEAFVFIIFLGFPKVVFLLLNCWKYKEVLSILLLISYLKFDCMGSDHV